MQPWTMSASPRSLVEIADKIADFMSQDSLDSEDVSKQTVYELSELGLVLTNRSNYDTMRLR
jgi:hypothetical protein